MDPAHARQLFIEAVAATERSGDRRRSYRLHNNAAVDALRAGDTAAARAHMDQAMEAMQAIGEENSHVIMNKGWVLRQENDTEGARSTFEAVLRISRRNGDRSGLATQPRPGLPGRRSRRLAAGSCAPRRGAGPH